MTEPNLDPALGRVAERLRGELGVLAVRIVVNGEDGGLLASASAGSRHRPGGADRRPGARRVGGAERERGPMGAGGAAPRGFPERHRRVGSGAAAAARARACAAW